MSDEDLRQFCAYQNYLMIETDDQMRADPHFDLNEFMGDVSSAHDQVVSAIRIPNAVARARLYEGNRNYLPEKARLTNRELWSAATGRDGIDFLKKFPKAKFEKQNTVEVPAPAALYALCTVYGCPAAGQTFSQVLKDMAPEGATANMESIRRVFANDRNIQVMARAALLIDEKVSAVTQGAPVTGNVFDDVLKAARQFIPNEKEARDLSWEIMAIYGTRGANMGKLTDRLTAHFAREEIGIGALQSISLGMSVLDQFAEERKQKIYSFPPNVSFNCAYGKPYHFWLAAYISRKYSQNPALIPPTPLPLLSTIVGKVDEAIKSQAAYKAALAAHLSLLGYNFSASNVGREPAHAFGKPLFGDYNNSVRVSIAVGDAGAVYGAYMADGGKTPSIDINQGIRQIIRNSKPRSKQLSTEEFYKQFENDSQKPWLFMDWRQFMGADQAFEYFRRSLPK